MKRLLRLYFINLLALYLIIQFTRGLIFEEGAKTFFITAGALTVATLLGKPVINLLLLPLNLVTFGIFRWVSSAIALYLVTMVVSDFKLIGFKFAGLSSKWLDIPSLDLKGITAYIAYSFLLSLIISFILWIRK